MFWTRAISHSPNHPASCTYTRTVPRAPVSLHLAPRVFEHAHRYGLCPTTWRVTSTQIQDRTGQRLLACATALSSGCRVGDGTPFPRVHYGRLVRSTAPVPSSRICSTRPDVRSRPPVPRTRARSYVLARPLTPRLQLTAHTLALTHTHISDSQLLILSSTHTHVRLPSAPPVRALGLLYGSTTTLNL